MSKLSRIEEIGPYQEIEKARKKVKKVQRRLDALPRIKDNELWDQRRFTLTADYGNAINDLNTAYETMAIHLKNNVIEIIETLQVKKSQHETNEFNQQLIEDSQNE